MIEEIDMELTVQRTQMKDLPILGRFFWNYCYLKTNKNILVSRDSGFHLPKRENYEILSMDYYDLLIGVCSLEDDNDVNWSKKGGKFEC